MFAEMDTTKILYGSKRQEKDRGEERRERKRKQ